MKKLIIGLFIFSFLTISAPQVHASALSDALLQIKNLKNELIQLQSKLKASVLDSSSDSQTIILKTGWNIISFNVNPSNLSLNSVFASMNPDNGEIISNEDAVTATYMNGSWGGGFTTIDTSKAYKIKVSRDKTLTVNGNIISINTSIPLRSGTNLVPYYPTVETDAVTVFSSIKTTCLKKVMDEWGKTYENFGAFGGWKNNIGTLKPGEGYTIFTTSSCILNYGDVNTTSVITSIPIVISPSAESITQTSAVLGANISSLGYPTSVSAYGHIYYGTSPRPSGLVVNTNTTATVGTYSIPVSGLTCGTKYYFYGALTNPTGTGYSSDGIFTTLPCGTPVTPSIIVGYSSSNITIGNGSEGRVLSFDVSSDTSDVNINSYTISFENKGSGSSRLSDYVSQIGVYTAMSRVALLDVSDFVKVGNIYSKTLVIPSDRNIIFAGKSRNFYINVKTNSLLDNTNINNSWKVSSNNIRYTLPSGFVNTNTGYAESTFTINSSTTESVECPSNGTPFIKVSTPNGGEVYQAGQQITVGWSSCKVPTTDKIFINLVNDNNSYALTGNDSLNDGSQIVKLGDANSNWSYPNKVVFGKNFKINVYQVKSPELTVGASDVSDNTFTINSSAIKITRTLRLGMRGKDVAVLQSYLGLPMDGVFGKYTRIKVIEWQLENGLKADGVFGRESRLKAGLE